MTATARQPDPRETGLRTSYRTALAVLVLGAISTLAVFTAAWREHRATVQAELRSEVEIGTRSFQFAIADYVDLVVALQAYAEGSGGAPDHRQLRAILARLARGQPAVQSLAYLPRVRREQRADFERTARAAGWPDFAILEHGADGRDRPAAGRSEYFPFYFFAPLDRNRSTAGFDMASDPVYRAAMERARDSGEPAGIARAVLVDEPAKRALIALAPVYATPDLPASPESRREALVGFAMGAFRMGDMIEHIVEQTGALRGFDHYFFEGETVGAETFFFARRAGPAPGAPAPFGAEQIARGIATVIDVMDRRWTVVSIPAGAPLFDPGALAWAVLAIGTFGTAAGFMYSISATRRTRELLSLAFGLRESKAALEREIAERERTQDQLSAALKIVENSSTVLSRWRFAPGESAPRLEYASPNFRRFGWTVEDVLPPRGQFLNAVHPDDRDRLARSLAAAIAERRGETQDEFRIVGQDGAVRWVGGHMTFEWDAASGAGHSVGLLRDITERKNAEETLLRERDFGAALVDGLPGIFFVLDADARIVRHNANLANVTGRTVEELRGLSGFANIAPPDHAMVRARIADVFEIGHAEAEVGILHTDGSVRRFYITARRIELDGAPGVLGMGVDVTEAREAERLLRESEEKFRTVFGAVTEGILLCDPAAGTIADLNESACALYGYAREELVGRTIEAVSSGVPPYTQADAMRLIQAAGAGGPQSFEWHCRTKEGRLFWAEIAIRQAAFGARTLALATLRDITERKQAAAQILQMARYDALTGLANRRVFAEAVQQAIARTQRGARGFAVLYLDLDHFKDVNDTLGHPVGDRLLRAVAGRLKDCVRETDTVARFGGDEFAVLALDITDPTDAGVLGDKVLKALSRPYSISGNEIRSGTSVGISVYGPDSPHVETLLAHADVALYRAKSEGRGTYRFFTGSMDAEVRKRVKLDADLRTALDTDQMFLLYQPQVEAASGRIVGVEALVRWRRQDGTIMTPDEFIGAAEKNGLIVPLGRWVLHAACRQAKAWREAGVPPVTMGVNLSALQFKVPLELEKDIAAALAENGVPPHLLELELTESVLMKASREHNDVLMRLRRHGLRLAIDDFGTGFSSLDYLRRFPVDRIKIAQVFIIDLVTAAGDAAIVKAAIGLARELGISVIAEGVETEAQLRLLQAWGCREVQGYFFGRPVAAEVLLPFLRGGRMAAGKPVRSGSLS